MADSRSTTADVADRYRRLADALTRTAEAVPGEAWGAPSPCEGWSAAQVLAHVAQTEWEHLGRLGLQPDVQLPDDQLTGDPTAAWVVVRDAVQAVLDDPERADTAFDGYFGPTTFATTIDDFYSADLLVHRWDLARATGLTDHEAMPDDEVERVHRGMASMGDAARAPGVFGPEVPVAESAGAQDKLLGFLGRRP